MANAKSLRLDSPNQIKVIRRRGLRQRMLVVPIPATPSLYLLFKFPPLWRNSDGFFQVYERFNHLTILHWPPLTVSWLVFPLRWERSTMLGYRLVTERSVTPAFAAAQQFASTNGSCTARTYFQVLLSKKLHHRHHIGRGI